MLLITGRAEIKNRQIRENKLMKKLGDSFFSSNKIVFPGALARQKCGGAEGLNDGEHIFVLTFFGTFLCQDKKVRTRTRRVMKCALHERLHTSISTGNSEPDH